MKDAQELSNEVVGMSIEAAQRAIDGVVMMDKPFAGEIRGLISGIYERWCGEVSEGEVLLLSDDYNKVEARLKDSPYRISRRGWHTDSVTERSYHHWHIFKV